MKPGLYILVLAAVLAVMPTGPAEAQVRRCVRPDGITVFTDRQCRDIGAVERLPRDERPNGGHRIYRGGCARNVQDLMYELTTAIDSGDVNRLASVYHWAGMSSRGSVGVMNRLDAVVRRPLVDIVPVMPAGPEGEDWTLYPQTTVRTEPVGLRVEQTLANGSTPSRTHFGLRRYFGCWWITG